MPKTIGDVLGEGLFGPSLDDELRLKCRYIYLHRRIQSRKQGDKDVPQRWTDRLTELEDHMMKLDIRPSEVLDV